MTHRGEPTQAYDFDEENSNTSANPTFDSVLGARLSRRGLLRGGVATAGTAVLGAFSLSACGGSDDASVPASDGGNGSGTVTDSGRATRRR